MNQPIKCHSNIAITFMENIVDIEYGIDLYSCENHIDCATMFHTMYSINEKLCILLRQFIQFVTPECLRI